MARPVLKKGMSGKKGTAVGEAILLWRLFLAKPELKPAAGVTSFDFGAATDKATRAWQKSMKLPENGIVDAATWAAYDKRIAGAPKPVQAKAAAIETAGEANKAAAMAAAVAAAKPGATPAQRPAPPVAAPVAPRPLPANPVAAAAVKTVTKAKDVTVQAAAQAKQAVSAMTEKVRVHTQGMSGLGRIVTVGVLGLGGLIGYKAIKK